jgi:hypothetical protein
LFSKNGTTENGGTHGKNDKNDDVGNDEFESVDSFLASGSNNNKETGETEYSEAFIIPATKEEDKSAIKGAKSELDKSYALLGSNCAKLVQNALKNAGKQDGSPSKQSSVMAKKIGAFIGGKVGVVVSIIANKKIPRLIYKRIKEQNNGKVN